MSAELSGLVRTGKRGSKTKKPPRHPWDWYVEQPWVTHRLIDFLPLERHVTYLDPACGQCTIPGALRERGFTAFGSDLFKRGDHYAFIGIYDFLGEQRDLIEGIGPLSIVMNPPFSYQDGQLVRGLAEQFVRMAMEVATHRVCALLPLKWMASAGRVPLFQLHPPSIYVLAERPSMPPGDKIAELGPRSAWKRGKVDYAWFCWNLQIPNEPYAAAPTYWIPPRDKMVPEIDLAVAA